MKITEEKEIVEKRLVVTDILCNKCGESCIVWFENRYIHLGLDSTVYSSYFNKVLDDLNSYTFSLCENCLFELFKQFKIPVEEKEELV